MFERYNEKARRSLFFARYEASKLGSRVIESEHILLGILREGEGAVQEIFRRFQVEPEGVRREIEGERVFVERISATAELPLAEASKKILAHAANEAESLHHQFVGTQHLLLGILRVEGCTAMRILARHGFAFDTVREEVVKATPPLEPAFRAGHAVKYRGSLWQIAQVISGPTGFSYVLYPVIPGAVTAEESDIEGWMNQ
jgi:ATP-dependent Clp protease ATP-binding subunit ClpC